MNSHILGYLETYSIFTTIMIVFSIFIVVLSIANLIIYKISKFSRKFLIFPIYYLIYYIVWIIIIPVFIAYRNPLDIEIQLLQLSHLSTWDPLFYIINIIISIYFVMLLFRKYR